MLSHSYLAKEEEHRIFALAAEILRFILLGLAPQVAWSSSSPS